MSTKEESQPEKSQPEEEEIDPRPDCVGCGESINFDQVHISLSLQVLKAVKGPAPEHPDDDDELHFDVLDAIALIDVCLSCVKEGIIIESANENFKREFYVENPAGQVIFHDITPGEEAGFCPLKTTADPILDPDELKAPSIPRECNICGEVICKKHLVDNPRLSEAIIQLVKDGQGERSQEGDQ